VNSGGVINIAEELAGYSGGYDQAKAYQRVRGIFDTTCRVLSLSHQQAVTPNEVAEDLAHRRMEQAVSGSDRIRSFDGTARRHSQPA